MAVKARNQNLICQIICTEYNVPIIFFSHERVLSSVTLSTRQVVSAFGMHVYEEKL